MTVSVTGADGATATPSGTRVFGIICDCSGSMEGGKIAAAKTAMQKLVALLPEDAYFFLIAGSENANLIMPAAQATAANKQRAAAAIRTITARGGTTISVWLGKALQQFSQTPNAIKQALLLTDGQNEDVDEARLDQMLHACEGAFQCDCRGVGTDWRVSELQKIAGKLLGTTDIIPDASQIEAQFQSILRNAMGKSVSDVALRLWTPAGARVLFCKQVSPEIVDLTQRFKTVKPQVNDYPTGAWGKDESRDYHFCIEVKPGEVGDEMLAGRASLVVTQAGVETKTTEARILAIWTDDDGKSTRIEKHVAHYTGQAELAQSIQDGLEARARGDAEVATSLLGKAVKIAHDSGNEATAKLLRTVVDVQDAESGTVRLKKQVAKEDAMALETRSTKTNRIART